MPSPQRCCNACPSRLQRPFAHRVCSRRAAAALHRHDLWLRRSRAGERRAAHAVAAPMPAVLARARALSTPLLFAAPAPRTRPPTNSVSGCWPKGGPGWRAVLPALLDRCAAQCTPLPHRTPSLCFPPAHQITPSCSIRTQQWTSPPSTPTYKSCRQVRFWGAAGQSAGWRLGPGTAFKRTDAALPTERHPCRSSCTPKQT